MVKLLDGVVLNVPDGRDVRIADLERELQQTQKALRRAQEDAAEAKTEAARSVKELRRQLGPLYRALQMVFGELDTIGGDEARNEPATHAAQAPTNDRTKAVWDAWKSKLGPAAARVIDVLLVHGEMNTTQLSIVAQMHRTNVPKAIFKLNTAGLIHKNGGKFSLKQL